MLARRAKVAITYKGKDITDDLAPYLSSFTFSDNQGAADDIQLTLQDRSGKWHGAFMPKKGDVIHATIITYHWKKQGETRKLSCGKFFVDAVDFQGPPDTLTIKALSIPIKESGKNAKNTRMWEKSTLSKIAGDIATSAGLELVFDTPDFLYTRVDQKRETDLAFIKRFAKREGIAVKVSNGRLVLYNEAKYEAKRTIRTITRGEDDLSSYSFVYDTADNDYQKVEITYRDTKKKKNLKYVYKVPGVDSGPTLKLNERADSLEEAKRIAKNAVREKNKKTKGGKLTLVGDTTLIQGQTIEIKGFLKFDGKYYIEKSDHGIGGNYTTNLEIREVLSY